MKTTFRSAVHDAMRDALRDDHRVVLQHRDSSVALEPKGNARGILRIFEQSDDVVAKLARRHRRAETLEERRALHAYCPRVDS